jgi:putative effector of murein hydrolase LrgA (UPF0299 family)
MSIRPWLKMRNVLDQMRNDEIHHLTWRIRVLGAFLVLALLLMVVPPLIAVAAPATQPIIAATQPATPVVKAAANVQQWWMPLLTPIIAALGTALAAFVTALISKLLKVIETKYKVDVPVMVEQLIADKAKQLVAAAEEEAERRILHGDGQATPGAEKSKQVVKGLMEFADSLGYGKQYQEEQAKRLADAVLHLSRVGSEDVIGSNGERAKLLARAQREGTSGR